MFKTYIAKPEVVRRKTASVSEELKLPAKRGNSAQLLIGRKEWLSLPVLGISPIHAKVDSGARSSSLHVEEMTEFIKDGEDWVRFVAVNFHGEAKACEVPVEGVRHVKSSSGSGSHRIFIQTIAEVGKGFRWPILVSLTNRSNMKHDMLLGRRALAGNFLIDCHRSHLLGRLNTV